jgi:hypothetical protein
LTIREIEEKRPRAVWSWRKKMTAIMREGMS